MHDIQPASWLRQVARPLRLALLCPLLTLAPAAPSDARTSASPPASASEQVQPAAPRSPFPLPVELRTPFPPTAFPSNGQTHLAYELYLTNYSSSALTLRSIEVIDAENPAARPVETFVGERLNAILKSFGDPSGASGPLQIDAGEMVIVFMWISFDAAADVPASIRHRVNTTEASTEGPTIVVRHTNLRVLSPPVRGSGWTISDGPNNEPSNHHRRGYFVMNGGASISRRYAIDWMQYRNGQSIARDEPVFAVADATVALVRDGLPDNTPAPVETFRPTLPNSMETIGGNLIALDLGGGQYAWYAHLQPGSILVRPGERVRRGERLARIGVSGDSNVPHLHFEVTNSRTLLAGEGLPYVFDRYRASAGGQASQSHTRELPLGGMVIDIGEGGS